MSVRGFLFGLRKILNSETTLDQNSTDYPLPDT